jgi:hypothetical protein
VPDHYFSFQETTVITSIVVKLEKSLKVVALLQGLVSRFGPSCSETTYWQLEKTDKDGRRFI